MKNLRAQGFTLVEVLVGSAVFLIVALSAYRAFGTVMDAVSISREKIAATALANERFEIMRNLPYKDVGIVGGIPSGKINRTENLIRDNYSFTVQTTIRNVDDPFDGTIGGNPPDTSPADYKLADLDITCTNCKILNPLEFVTLVAPHALETATNNGALFLQVIDASGLPVSGASVHIVNAQTNPITTIDETSDNGGWVKIVDAPPGTNTYNISVSKPGYSQDQTYPPGGAAGPTPNNPDSTVVVGQVTQASLSIDKTSSLSVSTVDDTCTVFPNIGFSLTGTKTIGAPSVLKYPTQNFTTNPTGLYNLPALEWDTYSALLSSAAYDLAGSVPFPTFALGPNQNKTLELVVVPHVDKALLVSVEDSTGAPIDGATVELQNGGFDEIKTTSSGGACPTPGQVFWNGLASGTYTLTVSKPGFQDNISSFSLSAWQNKIITLSL